MVTQWQQQWLLISGVYALQDYWLCQVGSSESTLFTDEQVDKQIKSTTEVWIGVWLNVLWLQVWVREVDVSIPKMDASPQQEQKGKNLARIKNTFTKRIRWASHFSQAQMSGKITGFSYFPLAHQSSAEKHLLIRAKGRGCTCEHTHKHIHKHAILPWISDRQNGSSHWGWTTQNNISPNFLDIYREINLS